MQCPCFCRASLAEDARSLSSVTIVHRYDSTAVQDDTAVLQYRTLWGRAGHAEDWGRRGSVHPPCLLSAKLPRPGYTFFYYVQFIIAIAMLGLLHGTGSYLSLS